MIKRPVLISESLRRYITVGFAAFFIEYGSFYILFSKMKLWLTFANVVSYCLAFAASFLLNRQWAFGSTNANYARRIHHQLVYYFGLSLINLLLTVWLVLGFKEININPLIGKPMAMVVTSAWNFVLYSRIIFRNK